MSRAAVAAAVAVVLLTGCGGPSVQPSADEQAGVFADGALLRTLQEAAAATPPQQREAAVAQRLREPDRQLMSSNANASWVVGEVDEQAVDVTVYLLYADRGFGNSSTYGIACRQYVVGDEVTARTVQCPDGTRSSPPPTAVGWDFR